VEPDPVNPNPNEEPMLLMLEKLKRLNAQAEHLDAKTGDVIGDFAKVTTGSVSSDDMAAKYAQAEAAMNTIAADMNPDADPCQDLYAYSCGRWINNTEIPSDRYSWSKTFSAIDRQNAAISLEIVSNIPTEHRMSNGSLLSVVPTTDSDGLKIPEFGDQKYATSSLQPDEIQTFRQFFQACMDVEGRDARGANDDSFQLLVAEISGAGSQADLLKVMGQKEMVGLSIAPVQIGVGPDDMDSSSYTAYVQQPKLKLPSDDMYNVPMEVYTQLKDLYHDVIRSAFTKVGYSGSADNVLAVETALSMITRSPEELQDWYQSYNPTTFAEFVDRFPRVKPFFDAIAESYPAMSGDNTLVDTTPDYFIALEELLDPDQGNVTLSTAELKDFAVWSLIVQAGPSMHTELADVMFLFFHGVLEGKTEAQKPPLEKKCVSETVANLWGLTDRLFVERTFGKDAQVQMEIMVNTIKEEFKIELKKKDWMDEDTRAEALDKLKEMNYKIGAPSKWPTYEVIMGNGYLENKLQIWKDHSQKAIANYDQKVDNTRWGMSPSEVNAYYSPAKNEMVFPAGILQPPFFDPSYPMVVNYASIGSIMGHELTHGFDDTGSLFDKFGQYRDWWSPDTKTLYHEKTQCFVDQYFALDLTGLEGTNITVEGNATLGENIADNGGAKISRKAFQRYAAQYGAPSTFDVGEVTMTADMLFWLGWGQTWCKAQDVDGLIAQIASDEHSPSQARVNGVAMNSNSFAEAAGCAVGTPMNPDHKCDLW